MQLPRSHLSGHAVQRLQERFRITPEELLRLLNAGLGKTIGVSARTHLAHRLLWSHVDGCLLVAIQDVVTGTLLTVLTTEMYQRDYEANLTEKRLRHVVNQMVHAGYAPPRMWAAGDHDEYVTLYARLSSSERLSPLGRYRGAIDSADLSTLGRKPEFWLWIADELKDRGLSIELLESVKGKFAGGEHQEIPYTVVSDA